ncbi:branched-chain amino acid transport system substrate-binding protein [Azospirillum agricola]|uniref:ABC transporter substrate-binding protein n=1 Tax=Azospirillum agricola TaxID=1720247 RepID=UPI001AE445A0|nr:ABC transporter substrate-binding protein [Azospirillum agricola]MBP2233151.1 branched-chain amino acid transport system substrate-binding protein [Azospirillum agricola]
MNRYAVTAAVAACLLAQTLPRTAGAQSAYSDGKIKIGVLTDLSGQLTDTTGQGSITAAQMAVEDFGGAVNGTPVELIFADHQNKADVGASTARRWYDVDQVDAIVDVPNSAVALAVQQITKEANRVAIFSSPASSDLTGKACTPNGIHWTYDTYALAHVTGEAVVAAGFKNWFFLTSDYAFGHALERDTGAVVQAQKGKVAGSVKMPANNADFSSFLLQAQASPAEVVALATAGADTQNAIKQAAEFGLGQSGKNIVALLLAINEVHALGLPATQGVMLTDPFYWDMDEETRAFSKRFFEKRKAMPTFYQAGVYGAVAHYLKAIKAAGTDAAPAVMKTMKATPVNDFMTKNGTVREDGRVLRDMHLFQVKTPAESKAPWDYYKLVRTVPGDKAFRPLAESDCPLVKKM